MRNELNHIETIERYLTGDMDARERNLFEAQLNADPGLKQEVDLQKRMMERLQLQAFKADMVASHDELAGMEQRAGWLTVVLNCLLGLLLFIGSAVVTALLLGNAPQLAAPVEMAEEAGTSQPSTPPENEENLTAIPDSVETSQPYQSSDNQYINANRDDKKTNKLVEKDLPATVILHEGFKKPFSMAMIDAENGGTVETKDSKSSIHFPPNSMVTRDGLQVIGTVEIRYREYRNPAEMVLSGIPMTYQEDSNDYAFNSAGMIEVRAYQDGKELDMKPGAAFTIDYNVTEQLDSCYFFALDDKTGKWDKRRAITFQNPVLVTDDAGPDSSWVEINGGLTGSVYDSRNPEGMFNCEVKLHKMEGDLIKRTDYKTNWKGNLSKTGRNEEPGNSGFTIYPVAPGTYMAEIIVEDHKKVEIPNVMISENYMTQLDVSLNGTGFPGRFVFRRKKREANYVQHAVQDSASKINGYWNHETRFARDTTPLNPLEVGQYAPTSPTRISPNLVQGLKCPAFGVYNCDQINLLNETVAVKASYKNGGGEMISDAYNLAMINLSYNASFGFEPREFNFEKGAKTVLLLFTKSNKVYVLPDQQFSQMNIETGNHYTFEMTDITSQVKTTAELKTYLEL